jgi:hypothetical protein
LRDRSTRLKLTLLPGTFAICRLSPEQQLPGWAVRRGSLISVTLTPDELSIVCPAAMVPPDVQCDRGWSALKVEGPLPLNMTGVLSALVDPLAGAEIPVFAISTFDTDYILVKQDQLLDVKTELEQFGHRLCLRPKQ